MRAKNHSSGGKARGSGGSRAGKQAKQAKPRAKARPKARPTPVPVPVPVASAPANGLMARLLGRDAAPEELSDGVPRDDRTLEIVTADIIVQRDANTASGPTPGRRPPPPPRRTTGR